MVTREKNRKGILVATVLNGAWRSSGFPPLDISAADLDEVTPLLCSSGAAALAWRRISETSLHDSSSGEVLHQSYRLQLLQAAMQEEKIAKVFQLLRAASVEPVLAKGWAAAGFYVNRDLRPFGDIDICVRAKDFQLAEDILRSPAASGCWVDLHKQFFEIGDRTVDEIFARSTLVQMASAKIRVLGPEDHLALLCIHLLKHGAWRPLWLCDIAAAIESLPANFDWQIFLGRRQRRAAWIACAIGLAHRLLGARIQDLPLKSELTAIPDWLTQGVLDHWSCLFPADHLPIRPAPLMANTLRTKRDIIKGVIDRWPDPITATFKVEGRFNNYPRLPYQLAAFILTVTRYLIHLPTKLQSER